VVFVALSLLISFHDEIVAIRLHNLKVNMPLWANNLACSLSSLGVLSVRRCGTKEQKFGFIKRVDKGWITTVKDLESWRFER